MSSDNEKVVSLQIKLDSAKRELSSWEEQGRDRRDGSGAQDRRFEEHGEQLGDLVYRLSKEIDDLKHAQNIIDQASTRVILKDPQ